MVKWLESLGHVTVAIIEIVMKVAPLGVFCLIFSVTARFGYDLLLNLLIAMFRLVIHSWFSFASLIKQPGFLLIQYVSTV